MALFSPTASLNRPQLEQLEHYAVLLAEWNQKINLVSRSDVERIQSYHIPHSLMLGYRRFPAGATVVDWGTGGGLPAIVLAIAFPSTRFIAVDRVGKKMKAVREMADELGLRNLATVQCDALGYDGPCDMAVSRATAPAIDLLRWTNRAKARKGAAIRPETAHPSQDPRDRCWTPGLVCLKGGDLKDEVLAASSRYPDLVAERIAIEDITGDKSWSSKYILHFAEGTDEHA